MFEFDEPDMRCFRGFRERSERDKCQCPGACVKIVPRNSFLGALVETCKTCRRHEFDHGPCQQTQRLRMDESVDEVVLDRLGDGHDFLIDVRKIQGIATVATP